MHVSDADTARYRDPLHPPPTVDPLDAALALSVAVTFALIPLGMVVGGLFADMLVLVLIGAALAVICVAFGAWLFADDLRADSLALRMTPLHYELIRERARYVGERDELELSLEDDGFRIRARGYSFYFDDLAPADVEALARFARENGLVVS